MQQQPRNKCRLISVLVALGFWLGVCTSPSLAVVIDVGDGSGNTTAPEDDPGFANVGIIQSGSGVYLGNRWVLTAVHVGPGAITLNGQSYDNIVDQTHRIENPAGLTPLSDLMLMRLREEPDLPSLRLGCSSVSVTSEVTLIGGGRDRATERSFWDRETVEGDKNDNWTLLPDDNGANEEGFFTDASRNVRWGTSIVTATNFDANSGTGDVFSFQTDFLMGPTVESSAQAVRGDSGGAVFQKNHGMWELVGMIHAVGLKDNQPRATDTAMFGGHTFGAELFDYADEIRSIADFEPEPGDFDGDGAITVSDIDAIFAAVNNTGFDSCHYDLTGNGTVSHRDIDQVLENAGALQGDANLDGEVGFDDFLLLARSFGEEGDGVGWGQGDFDGDDMVTFGDFLLLSRTFGEFFDAAQTPVPTPPFSSSAVSAVPEPCGISLIGVALAAAISVCRRRARASRSGS